MEESVTIIVRDGKAYIPTEAKTDLGVYIMTSPVYTISLDIDNNELTNAIERVLKAGNPKIPHPTLYEMDHLPQPVLKAAGVKSWKKLAEGGTSYSIIFGKEKISLYFSKHDKKGRFTTDILKTRHFPVNTEIKIIVQIILDDFHSRPELYRQVKKI